MTSQVTGSGKHKREAAVCSMESTTDDSPLKARFFAVRKEIYNRYKTEAADRTAGSQYGTQTKYVRARAGQWSYRSKQRHHRSRCKQADQPDCHRQIDQEALSWGLCCGVERSSAWKRFDVWFLQWPPRPQGYTGDCAVCWFHPPARMRKILFCPEGPLGSPKFFLRPMIVCSRRSCGSWPHFTRK